MQCPWYEQLHSLTECFESAQFSDAFIKLLILDSLNYFNL